MRTMVIRMEDGCKEECKKNLMSLSQQASGGMLLINSRRAPFDRTELMSDEIKIAQSVLKQESSFRRTVVGYFGSVLKSDLDPSIKMFTLIVLALFVFISFLIVILVLHLLARKFGIVTNAVPFTLYVTILAAASISTIGSGIPLMMRMSYTEHAQRLEAGFKVIEKKKVLRTRGTSVGRPTA